MTSAFASFFFSFHAAFVFFFYSGWNRTRGSPDSSRLSGSSGSTSTTPSQRSQFQRRLFWPLHLWTKASTAVPSAPDAGSGQRGNRNLKVEISQPVPMRPTKLQTTGQNGNYLFIFFFIQSIRIVTKLRQDCLGIPVK